MPSVCLSTSKTRACKSLSKTKMRKSLLGSTLQAEQQVRIYHTFSWLGRSSSRTSIGPSTPVPNGWRTATYEYCLNPDSILRVTSRVPVRENQGKISSGKSGNFVESQGIFPDRNPGGDSKNTVGVQTISLQISLLILIGGIHHTSMAGL